MSKALWRVSTFLKTAFQLQPSYFAKAFSSFIAGQPVHDTHPKLLARDELMPGITTDEIAGRRKKLMSRLSKESIAIISSATIKQMTDVVPYPFRQDADYLYYTGCQQPGGIAVIEDGGELCMFMPDHDPERTVWEGHLADTSEAVKYLRCDCAFFMHQLAEVLSPKLEKARAIYVNRTHSCGAVSRLNAFEEALQSGKVHDLKQYTDEVRWIKSPAEVKLMKHSAAIACQSFLQCMKVSREWPFEHFLAATMEYECKVKGAQRLAFPSVVGGGSNATVIHYSRNDQWIQEGELVLLDAGCEYFGYVSDVTRTWSPSGIILDAQRELYEIVLATSRECLKLCAPGVTLKDLHTCASDMLLKCTKEIALMNGQGSLWKINPTYIGHFLGLDVHDCGSISKDRKLKPGVVITIEPGLYVPPIECIPKRFHGIGIRIEDEVLITESSHEVLTDSIPKELSEIEAWIQS